LGLASLGWTKVHSLRKRGHRVSLDLLKGFHLRYFLQLCRWAEAKVGACRSNEPWLKGVKRVNEGGTFSGPIRRDFPWPGSMFFCRVGLAGQSVRNTAFARSGLLIILIGSSPSSSLPQPSVYPFSHHSTTDAATSPQSPTDTFHSPSPPFPLSSFPRNRSGTNSPSRHPPLCLSQWWNTSTLDTILNRCTTTRFRFVRASASRSSQEMTSIATAGGRCVRSLLRLAPPRLRLSPLPCPAIPFPTQPRPHGLLEAQWACSNLYVSFRHTPSLTSLHLPR
jgi:hypothetical protein